LRLAERLSKEDGTFEELVKLVKACLPENGVQEDTP